MIQESPDCSDCGELSDVRPCRRDRRTNNVSGQFELQAEQQPNSKPSPYGPPPTRRTTANKGRNEANERLDRRICDHQGCRRLDIQGTVAAQATDYVFHNPTTRPHAAPDIASSPGADMIWELYFIFEELV
jgi:hypothetical protein